MFLSRSSWPGYDSFGNSGGDAEQVADIWTKAQRTAIGFVLVLLLYTVPVPSLLTYALVTSVQWGASGQSGNVSVAGTSTPSSIAPTPIAASAAEGFQTAPSIAATTLTPTAAPTPAVTTQALQAPASTCSATVKFPNPGDGGSQMVYITSTLPSSSVTTVVHYKTTDHMLTAATDSGGTASVTFSIGRPTIGFPVNVDVTVGAATCSTSFTPQ